MVELMKRRTRKFGVDTLKLCANLPSNREINPLINQIVRSSTSVGANYRAACRAKSTRDMINKLKIVEEEADETLFFIELMKEANMVKDEQVNSIYNEGEELLAIIVASIKTLRSKSSIKNRQS